MSENNEKEKEAKKDGLKGPTIPVIQRHNETPFFTRKWDEASKAFIKKNPSKPIIVTIEPPDIVTIEPPDKVITPHFSDKVEKPEKPKE